MTTTSAAARASRPASVTQIANAGGKLANPTFVDKAPPAVVEQEKKRLADKEAELAQIRAQLDKLS